MKASTPYALRGLFVALLSFFVVPVTTLRADVNEFNTDPDYLLHLTVRVITYYGAWSQPSVYDMSQTLAYGDSLFLYDDVSDYGEGPGDWWGSEYTVVNHTWEFIGTYGGGGGGGGGGFNINDPNTWPAFFKHAYFNYDVDFEEASLWHSGDTDYGQVFDFNFGFMTPERAEKAVYAATFAHVARRSAPAAADGAAIVLTKAEQVGWNMFLINELIQMVRRQAEDRKNDNWSYITYEMYHPFYDIWYVGRASGYGTPGEVLARRLTNHQYAPNPYRKSFAEGWEFANLHSAIMTKGSDYGAWCVARGREQMLYDKHLSSDHFLANLSRGVKVDNHKGLMYHSTAVFYQGELHPYTGNPSLDNWIEHLEGPPLINFASPVISQP